MAEPLSLAGDPVPRRLGRFPASQTAILVGASATVTARAMLPKSGNSAIGTLRNAESVLLCGSSSEAVSQLELDLPRASFIVPHPVELAEVHIAPRHLADWRQWRIIA